jgi:hypothetical protein
MATTARIRSRLEGAMGKYVCEHVMVTLKEIDGKRVHVCPICGRKFKLMPLIEPPTLRRILEGRHEKVLTRGGVA